MEINNSLIEKWEPKIHRMTQNLFIVGMDKEDIQQELRISIMKAAKSFDEKNGAIFHTYLHTSIVVSETKLTIRTRRYNKSVDAFSYALCLLEIAVGDCDR